MSARRALLLLIVVIGLVAAGCGVRKVHRSIAAAAVPGGTGWKGGPIHVRKGDKVVITVGNTTPREHGFSIGAFGIKDTVQPGKKVEVKLTPTRTGHFDVYCQLHPAHKHTELNVT